MSAQISERRAFKATEERLTLAAIGYLALRMGLIDDVVAAIEELSANLITEAAADPDTTPERRRATHEAQAHVLRQLRAFQRRAPTELDD